MTEEKKKSWYGPLGLTRGDVGPILEVCRSLNHVHDEDDFIRLMYDGVKEMRPELVYLSGVITALKVAEPEIRRQIIDEMMKKVGEEFLKPKSRRL